MALIDQSLHLKRKQRGSDHMKSCPSNNNILMYVIAVILIIAQANGQDRAHEPKRLGSLNSLSFDTLLHFLQAHST